MSSQDAYNVVFGALIIGLFIFNNNLRDEIQQLKWDAISEHEVMAIAEDEVLQIIKNCDVLGTIRIWDNEGSNWINGRLGNGKLDC
jgi:hypothetical protein